MGYYSHFSGQVIIDPPLRWKEIRESPWHDPDYADFRIEIEERTEETPDGAVTTKRGVAIVPWQEDSYKGYSALESMREIVEAFPEHEFLGMIRVEGEESGDIWRIVVRDGKVERENAAVVWPDGTNASLR